MASWNRNGDEAKLTMLKLRKGVEMSRYACPIINLFENRRNVSDMCCKLIYKTIICSKE